MCVDSVSTTNFFDVFEEEDIRREKNPPTGSVYRKFSEDLFFSTFPAIIQNNNRLLQEQQNQIKPFGEGSYEASVERDSDGKTSASGSISYETDRGTKVEIEGRVDNEGNASGKVSVGGKF